MKRRFQYRLIDLFFLALHVAIFATVFTERVSIYQHRKTIISEYQRQSLVAAEEARREDLMLKVATAE